MDNVVDSIETILKQAIKPNKGPPTPLETMIEIACHAQKPEPDLSLNLEICDHINSTKKNTPREAAMALVELINGRDAHRAMLALSLLDCCVKNCGYPFHLQLANKDFLNELVHRFPERPPPSKTMVQEKILEYIQHWYLTIYEQSPQYKEDLGHIYDMYRLLQYKGYRFPTLKEDSAKVMKATHTMKTKEEMQSEDRAAQEAKLQELLRRGTPADLKAANDLMKVMSGYHFDKQPDYEKKESEELDRVEEKAKLLVEVLKSIQPGEDVTNYDSVQTLLGALKVAKTKVTKFIEENIGEEDEKCGRYLHVNDNINEALEKYEALKKKANPGQVSQAASALKLGSTAAPSVQTNPVTAGATTKVAQLAAQQSSTLIDLLGDDFGAPPPVTTAAPASLSNPTSSVPSAHSNEQAILDLAGISFNSNQMSLPVASGGGGGSIRLDSTNTSFWTPGPQIHPSKPPSLSASTSSSPPLKGIDLHGASRSPFAGPSTAPMHSQPLSSTTAPPLNTMQPSLPQGPVEKTLFEKNGFKITINSHIEMGGVVVSDCYFSNSNPTPISNLVFQLAVPVTMKLHMEPLTGTVLPPKSVNSVMQSFKILNPAGAPIKLRFKISYTLNSLAVVEQGESASLF